MNSPNDDLSAVIVAAVNARIETSVLEALSGDEFMGRMIQAVLQKEVEVKDGYGYRTRKSTFLRETIDSTLETAVKSAVAKTINQQTEALEAAVTEELSRNVGILAQGLVAGMQDKAAGGAYSINVQLAWRERD